MISFSKKALFRPLEPALNLYPYLYIALLGLKFWASVQLSALSSDLMPDVSNMSSRFSFTVFDTWTAPTCNEACQLQSLTSIFTKYDAPDRIDDPAILVQTYGHRVKDRGIEGSFSEEHILVVVSYLGITTSGSRNLACSAKAEHEWICG